MASFVSLISYKSIYDTSFVPQSETFGFKSLNSSSKFVGHNRSFSISIKTKRSRDRSPVVNKLDKDANSYHKQEEEVSNLGVKAALSILRFYKREISPLLPKSCRYVPTCSEYSMIAYKRYGVVKGTILTAWRLCRCNPLGGSGFDPPRWFDEKIRSEEEEEEL